VPLRHRVVAVVALFVGLAGELVVAQAP